MYYFDYAYTGKGTTKIKTKTGTKIKKAASCKNRFHYITRTAHYKNHKDNLHEKVEFVKSGNMPSFAKKRPDLFWEAAHNYERKMLAPLRARLSHCQKSYPSNSESNLRKHSLKNSLMNLTFHTQLQFIIISVRLADKINRTCISCIASVQLMNIIELLNSFSVATTTKTLPTVEHKRSHQTSEERQNNHQ